VSKRSACMPLTAIRGKTECPRRVSVSLRSGFDSHRLHHFDPGHSAFDRDPLGCPKSVSNSVG
jgi:hypothetical protein